MTTNDAQIAREWAERAMNQDLSDDVPRCGYRAAARHILDTTTPPTMAEVEWDDDVHAGLCAEHCDGYEVLMLGKESWDDDRIYCRWTCGGEMIFGPTNRLHLTPIPGTKIDLTPRREPEPESTPEPEGVKPDPQPGEAWLIEYEGKRYEAVYWYSPLYAHWVFVRDREGACSIESHEAAPVSRLVPESTPEHPEFLETEEDYEEAQFGTIVALDEGKPFVMINEWWRDTNNCDIAPSEMAGIRRRVLRRGWKA